jgi:hypothetical protein
MYWVELQKWLQQHLFFLGGHIFVKGHQRPRAGPDEDATSVSYVSGPNERSYTGHSWPKHLYNPYGHTAFIIVIVDPTTYRTGYT